MVKCYICRSNPKHQFKDCVSATCSCACVQELHSFPRNELVEDVPNDSPKFLKIPNVEIKKLPDLAKIVTQFNKVDRGEWLPKREDKRFKSKRKRIERDSSTEIL